MNLTFQEKNQIDKLNYISATCDLKINESIKAKKEQGELNTLLARRRNDYAVVLKTVAFLKPKKKDLVEFNNIKKETALSEIYAGIYSAQQIVQGVGPTRLKIDKGSALLVNDKDLSVNSTEGSAYRALLSFNTRGIVLKNTEYEQTLIFDEPLATLSAETSALFSAKLSSLAKQLQIILVEQKSEVFADTDATTFFFKKSEGETHIRRVIQT